MQDEQNKDLALFRSKQIDEAFLKRVFATPNQSMWFPAVDTLLSAGVVDRIVRESDAVDPSFFEQDPS